MRARRRLHRGSGRSTTREQHELLQGAVPLSRICCSLHGEESKQQRNRFLVLRLCEAPKACDVRRAQSCCRPTSSAGSMAPPARQHMIRLLTGAEKASSGGGFVFPPRSVDVFESAVIAEGANDARQLYWVHAWTAGPDGVIT
ncbi:hypothetical protein BAE44_0005041 [Dichanthelium oligosanthes]|uniref:Wound-induced protein 1 n=1 Tax=Dichanthelium oligosanthes TaxID=888268 RepID=A0A1E5W961_9POAL|nr:hypothetical protein BAE44_0005041 [Dichanthelium oligosanthes]